MFFDKFIKCKKNWGKIDFIQMNLYLDIFDVYIILCDYIVQ